MLHRAETLENYKLKGIDGELGSTKDFYFDDRFWTIRYLVANTGNWLIGRKVLLSPYSLVAINKEDENIIVDLDEKQIEESPSLDSDKPVSRQFEKAYFDYYTLPTYWGGRHMWGAWPYLMREEQIPMVDKEEKESWNPNLRSTKAVTGHQIQANDGEIGHVEDFIIDEETWSIRYLIIDTKNWWGGKKVLVSPQWIDRISWEESKVFIDLSQERIKQSPEYSDDLLLTRDYEDKLYKHYKRKGYWTE